MNQQEVKLQLAEIAGTWVAALAVVIGGFFGIYQYLEHKADVRVDRSMAFVERYHGDGKLVEARLEIIDSMASRAQELVQILQELPEDAVANTYDKLILDFINEDKLAGPLQQIFTFYEQMVLCRKMELCDNAVAKQFFDIDAEGFVSTYYPYVCHLRTEWHNPLQYQEVMDFYLPKLVC